MKYPTFLLLALSLVSVTKSSPVSLLSESLVHEAAGQLDKDWPALNGDLYRPTTRNGSIRRNGTTGYRSSLATASSKNHHYTNSPTNSHGDNHDSHYGPITSSNKQSGHHTTSKNTDHRDNSHGQNKEVTSSHGVRFFLYITFYLDIHIVIANYNILK
jgi:hypothetical protein